MDRLSPFRAAAPEGWKKKKRHWVVEIRDPKTKQSLVVEHDEPLDSYVIDVEAAGWGEGERHPDGILIAELGDTAWVCLIELKQSAKHKGQEQAPAERALDQVEGGARYFHPEPVPSRGRAHHDQWANRTDELEIYPTKEHRVVGIVVVLRQAPRPPPVRGLRLGEKNVPLRVVQIPMKEPNRAIVSFTRLLADAGIT